MDWIKKNPAPLTLAIAAALAITATVLLWMKVSDFDSTFAASRGTVPSKTPVEPLSTKTLDDSSAAIAVPVKWESPAADASKLFVSKLYVIKDGKLVSPGTGSFHPPVPNEWLQKYHLNELSATVLNDDPDGDGFTTGEEWNGLDAVSHLDMSGQRVKGPDGQNLPDDSTDPIKAEQHPPYHTKLELVRIHYITFRLKFMSYDIDAKKKEDTTVFINTLDLRGKTHVLKVGDDIPGTRFKVEAFTFKEIDGADGTKVDVSEATVKNKETGESVVLPLKKEVNSPDSYGIFHYKWVKPGVGGKATPDFPKRRGETFNLEPEKDKIYKVIEIRGKNLLLELPDGTKKTLIAP